MQSVVNQFEQALLDLDKVEARRLLEDSVKAMSPVEVAGQIVAPALERMGNAWHEGALSLSQIYMAGRICEQLIDLILPPAASTRKYQPKMAITTLNDYHMLGKRIVYSHFRSVGFELQDYGRTGVDELVTRLIEDRVDVAMISTLMYFSALQVKDVRAQLLARGADVKLLVGGAPFNMDLRLWAEVGADAMARDGAEAVDYVSRITEPTEGRA